MKQKPTQHKLGDFMEGKGFYIVLFLCIAAIGISGYYLFSGLFAEPEGFGSEPSSVVSGQAELEGDQNPGATNRGDHAARPGRCRRLCHGGGEIGGVQTGHRWPGEDHPR